MQTRIPYRFLAIVAASVSLTSSNVSAQRAHDPNHQARPENHHPVSVSDSADAVAVLHRFHAALEKGDSTAALALLLPDVTILESGGIETLAQYRSHHLGADIAFAKAVPSKRTVVSVNVAGGAAWVASTSISQGESGGRAVNSAGAELIVLRKVGADWKISAIHWSSRRRSTGG
jgi:ketosteroid isomerase-like protein